MYPVGYDPKKFVSCPGERFKIEYIGVPNEYGEINLEEVGKTDLVEMHNRDRDLNNVNILYERFCNGDVSALSQIQGSYVDAFGLPKDLRGMYETVDRFRTAYDNLPAETRQKFSFEEFLDNAGSEQWIKNFVPQVEKTNDTEPISNE